MFICVCNQVTDQQIFSEALRGANTLEDIQASTNACTTCQRCLTHVRAILRQGVEMRMRDDL